MKRNIVTSSIAALALAVGLVVAPITAASAADSSVSMDMACQLEHGAGWKAILIYNTTAYGWKCYAPPYGAVKKAVNVQVYCNAFGLGSAVVLNTSDPWSWRCRS